MPRGIQAAVSHTRHQRVRMAGLTHESTAHGKQPVLRPPTHNVPGSAYRVRVTRKDRTWPQSVTSKEFLKRFGGPTAESHRQVLDGLPVPMRRSKRSVKRSSSVFGKRNHKRFKGPYTRSELCDRLHK